jgi:hypothetical protein
VGPPVGGEVGGEAAHLATARSPSPEIKESRTKVSGDEGCRREVEISSPNGRGQRGDGATRRSSSPPPVDYQRVGGRETRGELND